MGTKLKPATVRRLRAKIREQMLALRRDEFRLQDRCAHEWKHDGSGETCEACGKERDWRRS